MGVQRFRLLQARIVGDPVVEEERAAFASRLGISVDLIDVHDCIEQPTTADIVSDGVDAVLVGGSGQYSVYGDDAWLSRFKSTLAELADRQFPTFASCFGFQALIEALGGEVRLDAEAAEVGTYALELTPAGSEDPLFAQLPRRFMAQEGHKDRALRLPANVVNLASSALCPYQAIRIGPGPVYATQFHPELTGIENRTRFQRYLTVYSNVFGDARAQEMLEGFTDSPATVDLLARFARMIHD
jgi:GMP synthase (glutamine-hydrolysing)